jgi:hypothetical protein
LTPQEIAALFAVAEEGKNARVRFRAPGRG